ncbi:isoleucine--tRNA ligase [Ignisphaera sp. 4213-co]|uniref:Isoleucine--tRNA ligase n=1 Tax=Ignisphaera cupida TaxID=3050454 RepID=A0ABD4Z834_9CREN|nr:isoleucine--tRNA ligase [Ignisphaera sp. 4213-co]MDK6029102.1 isoleucine--tRNA ligase [Ignisphaera sp. 4213-co]
MIALSSTMSVKGRYDPVKVEQWVLEFWKANGIYDKVKKDTCSQESALFRFLEGPPTANGFMHVGHARGRTFKDIVLRYNRMKGVCVWDQAGWDTQGLPVELEVEKNLKIKSKKDIELYGVDKFIYECQKLVDYYISHWRKASERLGLWLDYDNAYETRHPKYIEAVWMFLKKMWDKGLLYEDYRVIPVCPRCETALSSHEVALGYKLVKDPSLYFKIKLADEETYVVAWTTTPWTIIANEALAVHPNEKYVKIKVNNEYWIIAEKRLKPLVSEIGLNNFEVVDAFPGSSLFNKKYIHPLLDEVPAHKLHEPSNHRILVAEWVSMEEGTGIVHIAPAHGPEDYELGKKYGLIVFKPIQKNGVFTDEAGAYKGMWFKDASKKVVEDLKRKDLVVHISEVEHEYPHCWRCETPLMYYADRQWFLRIDPIKNTMIEENRRVEWHPEWAGKRFEDWIVNARDWCISRERYWGTPLPIWTCLKCGHRIAVGSIEELERLSNRKLEDVHRPWIDKITIKCPRCGSEMFREPFVVDVWMDSGMAHTASLAQINKLEMFNNLFPYDWITEAIDQTRGWFYTLIFTSTSLYSRSPYKKVLCQGHVLDKYGKKMSKSRGNVIWALDFMEKKGADILRLYVTSKAAPWDNINFDPDETDDIKSVLNILWNATNFADTYMSLDKWNANNLHNDIKYLLPEDHWILHEVNNLINLVEKAIEENDLHIAARAILNFITESLSHRYITVIRPRVWIEKEAKEKRAAYATLFLVLTALYKVLAPFAPFISEYLYQAFTRKYGYELSKDSVHLERWSRIEIDVDKNQWSIVNNLFKVADEILALRAKYNIKRRWPLKKMWIRVSNDDEAKLVSMAKHVVQIYANVKSVEIENQSIHLSENIVKVCDKPYEVFIDVTMDEEAVLEGLARDFIRRVQMYRKELNLPVDHVLQEIIVYSPSQLMLKALEKHRNYIANEIRAQKIVVTSTKPEQFIHWNIEDNDIYVQVNI